MLIVAAQRPADASPSTSPSPPADQAVLGPVTTGRRLFEDLTGERHYDFVVEWQQPPGSEREPRKHG